MYRTGESYEYETRCMIQYILEGHTDYETAKEFNTSRRTVLRRIKNSGYSYKELRDTAKKD